MLDACARETDVAAPRWLPEAGRHIAEDLGGPAPQKIKAILVGPQCRVDVDVDRLDVSFARSRLADLLAGTINLKMHGLAPPRVRDYLLTLSSPVALKRVGREMRMLIDGVPDQAAPDPRLLRILRARASVRTLRSAYATSRVTRA